MHQHSGTLSTSSLPTHVNGHRADRALLCSGLVKRYADVTAVNGLDLEVMRGECFGLLGPNGAGKTTTVEIFEGLTRPDDGKVEVLGMEWGTGKGNDARLRTRLGVQLQETQLTDKLTVDETVALFRSFYPQGRSLDEIIAMVELDEKRSARVGKLSGGQKQRLALACALVGDPDILFLDEPTTGLDPQARLKLWEIAEEFKSTGGTILLTTHYMEEAARLCDRIAVIDHGRVISLGTPGELIARLDADQIVEFTVRGSVNREDLMLLPGISHAPVDRDDPGSQEGGADENTYRLAIRDIGVALPALLAELSRQGVELVSLITHQATLEDVFVNLTGRRLRDV